MRRVGHWRGDVGIANADEAFVFGYGLGNFGHDRALGGLECLGDELMPVETLTFDREEERAGLHFARVDDDGVGDEFAALNDRAADHRGDFAEGQRGHTALPTDRPRGHWGAKTRGGFSNRELAQPRAHEPQAFSSDPASLRSPPFPRSCPAIPNRPRSQKRNGGAGREHPRLRGKV